MLLLGTIEGFGYSLPDDLLSGTGLRAADGFLKATPSSAPTYRRSCPAVSSLAPSSSRDSTSSLSC
jgi:hypothetical protein